MREFLDHYGLLAAFLLALLENDVSFLAIGVAGRLGAGESAASGGFNIYAALLAAIAGALIHDSFWFAIGHQHSDWFKTSRVYRRIGPVIERLAERFGPWEILLARFFYGTRNPTSIFWGIQHLRYATFAGIEMLALTVWGGLLVTISFNFTGLALVIVGHLGRNPHSPALLITLAVALLGIYLWRWHLRRRADQRRTELKPLPDPTSESASPAERSQ